MRRSRLTAQQTFLRTAAAAAIAVTLCTPPVPLSAALAQLRGQQNPDWPCRQIMVGRVSLAAVWSGPPVEGVSWQKDRAVADLAARLAARRTSLEDAEQLIDEFASSQGAEKANKLVAVFAGVFEILNDERTQVIEGLLRSGAKQRELAAKIRAESASPGDGATTEPPSASDNPGARAQELEWDLRVFDERRQSISYVCEAPTLIEQRLFALAKIIQRHLD